MSHCEQCGDSDWKIGLFEDDKGVYDYLIELCDDYHTIHYIHDIAKQLFEQEFELSLDDDFDDDDKEQRIKVVNSWINLKGE